MQVIFHPQMTQIIRISFYLPYGIHYIQHSAALKIRVRPPYPRRPRTHACRTNVWGVAPVPTAPTWQPKLLPLLLHSFIP
nr:hypothetical protein [Bacteroides intestinalis]